VQGGKIAETTILSWKNRFLTISKSETLFLPAVRDTLFIPTAKHLSF